MNFGDAEIKRLDEDIEQRDEQIKVKKYET